MTPYSIRDAKPDEQRELTRLVVRATLHAGYDEAFIDRALPGLTITPPAIAGGGVQVAEQSGEVIGVVEVMATALQETVVFGIFVDPLHWKRGVGRALFEAAIDRARTLKAAAIMIYPEPTAEGFYKRMGAIRIGEGPFYFSPPWIVPLARRLHDRDAATGYKELHRHWKRLRNAGEVGRYLSEKDS